MITQCFVDDDFGFLFFFFCRLLYTYVSAHDGTFDGPEKASLRALLESRETSGGQGVVMGLGADELKALKNALT